MKAFAVVQMTGGVPDFSNLPCTGNVLCAKTPDMAWGIYIITGTPAQLAAINPGERLIGFIAPAAIEATTARLTFQAAKTAARE